MDNMNTIDLSSYDTLITETKDRLFNIKYDYSTQPSLKNNYQSFKYCQNKDRDRDRDQYDYRSNQTESNCLYDKRNKTIEKLSPYRDRYYDRKVNKDYCYTRESNGYELFNIYSNRPNAMQRNTATISLLNRIKTKQNELENGNGNQSKTKEEKIRKQLHTLQSELNWYKINFTTVNTQLTKIRSEKESILQDLTAFQEEQQNQIKSIETILANQLEKENELSIKRIKEKNSVLKNTLSLKSELENSLNLTKQLTDELNDRNQEIYMLKEDVFYKDKQITEMKYSLSQLRKSNTKSQRENSQYHLLYTQQEKDNTKLINELNEYKRAIGKTEKELRQMNKCITDLKDDNEKKDKEINLLTQRNNNYTSNNDNNNKQYEEDFANRETKYIKEIIELKTQLLMLHTNIYNKTNYSIISEIQIDFVQSLNCVKDSTDTNTNDGTTNNKTKNMNDNIIVFKENDFQLLQTKSNESINSTYNNNDTNSNLNKQIKILTEQKNELDSQNEKLSETIVHNQCNAEKIKKIQIEKSNAIESLNKEIQRLVQQIDVLTSNNKELESMNEEYKCIVPKLENDLKHSQHENKELLQQGRIIDYQKRICDEETIQNKDNSIKGYQALIEQLNQKLNESNLQKEELTNKINNNIFTLEQLTSQIEDLKVQNNELTNLYNSLNKKQAQDEYLIQDLTNKNNELIQKGTSYEVAAISKLIKENNTLKENNNSLNDTITTLTKEKEKLLEENDNLIRENNALSDNDKCLQDEIVSLKDKKEKEKKETMNTIASMKEDYALTEDKNKTLIEKITSLTTNNNQLIKDNKIYLMQINEFDDKLNLLKEQYNSQMLQSTNQLEAKTEDLTLMSEKSKLIDSLEEQNDTLAKELKDITNQLSLSQQNKHLLNNELSNLKSQHKEMTNQNTMHIKDKEDIFKKLNEYQNTINSLQDKTKDIDKEKDKTNTLSKEQKDIIDALKQKNNDLKKQISQLQNQFQHANLEKSQYENDKQNIQSSLNKSEESMIIIAEENSKLKALLVEKESEIIIIKNAKTQQQSEEASKEKSDKRKKENHILKNRNALLMKELTILKAENEVYKNDLNSIASIKQENETLKTINDSLTSKLENNAKSSNNNNNAMYQKEILFLKQTIEQKEQKIIEITHSNETLETDYYDHLKQIESLQNHIQQLESQLAMKQ